MVNSTYFQFVNVGSNPTLPMKKRIYGLVGAF